MKVISVVNNKGGVGKTTISKTLAEYFSILKGEKVLIIDCDPQANLSSRYLQMDVDPYSESGVTPPVHPLFDRNEPQNVRPKMNPNAIDDEEWNGRSSIAGLFFGEEIWQYDTYVPNLQILPSHSEKLLIAERVHTKEVVELVYNQLEDFLRWPSVKEAAYDKVIIDTPPEKGPLTIAAIRASTDLIIPSIMEPLPIEGIFGMVHLWRNETMRRPDDNPINLIGVIPTFFLAQSTLHKDCYFNLCEQMPDYIFETKLIRRVVHPELDAPEAKGTSIFNLCNSNAGKKDVLAFCREFEERMKSYVVC